MDDFYDHDDQPFDHQREIEEHFNHHRQMDRLHHEEIEFERMRNDLYKNKHSSGSFSSPFSILAAISFAALVLFASQGATGGELAIPFILMIIFILAPMFNLND